MNIITFSEIFADIFDISFILSSIIIMLLASIFDIFKSSKVNI